MQENRVKRSFRRQNSKIRSQSKKAGAFLNSLGSVESSKDMHESLQGENSKEDTEKGAQESHLPSTK